MNEPTAIINICGISKNFGGVRALHNVSLSINEGELFAIVGENGAGKSTLMKILAGVYSFGSYEGNFFIGGAEARFHEVHDAEKANIVMIPQELNVAENLSVEESLFVGRLPSRMGFVDWDQVSQSAKKIVAKYGIDVPIKSHMEALSISQKQLVELAKAMSKEVKILILDEPTTSLTPSEIDRLFKQLKILKDHGVTCIYISHRLEEVCQIADRVAVLRDGKLITVRDNSNLTKEEIVSLMIGRDLSQMYPKQEAPIGDILLEVQNLNVTHWSIPGRNLVCDASFQVRAGEIVGLFGLVGAGRSDLVNAIFGAHQGKVSGGIFVKGQLCNIKRPSDAIRSGIGLVTEDRKDTGVFSDMSVAHNMTITIPGKISQANVIQQDKEVVTASSFVKALSIKIPSLQHSVNSLSGGNQQKVVIAKWLATDPTILILDEPTRGVDVGAKVEIYQILNSLAAQGVGILVVSSEVPEIIGICDRIMVMWRGQIVNEVTRAEATEELLVQWAIGGRKIEQ